MIFVPAGTFLMGSERSFEGTLLQTAAPRGHRWEAPDSERPVHEVYLEGFWIDQYPVTIGQYRRFCYMTGRRFPLQPLRFFRDRAPREDYPIVNVNWYDAVAYAQWSGKELPTEAQWEKAARGGIEQALYPWGDEPPDSKKVPLGLCGPAPVMRYSPNRYGLYDLVGNVYQWCQDWYDPVYYKLNPTGGWRNPRGPELGYEKVLRGGCWYEVDWEAEVSFRVAYRFRLPPKARHFPGLEGARVAAIGFRCVLSGDRSPAKQAR